MRPDRHGQAYSNNALLGRNTSRAQMRKAFTHVAIISSDRSVQKLLPQVLLVGKTLVTLGEIARVQADAPENIHWWRRETSWITKESFSQLLTLLGEVLRKRFPDRQAILLLDAHSVHCSPQSLQRAAREGIWICILPGSCTHVLQPLDTDVFSVYKRDLRDRLLDRCSRGRNGDLSFSDIAKCVHGTIDTIISQRSWRKAFSRTGYADPCRLREGLSESLPPGMLPATHSSLPSLQQFQACYISRRDVPFDLLLKPILRVIRTAPDVPSPESVSTSRSVAPASVAPWHMRLRVRRGVTPSAAAAEAEAPALAPPLYSSGSPASSSSCLTMATAAGPRPRVVVLTSKARFPPRPAPRRSQEEM